MCLLLCCAEQTVAVMEERLTISEDRTRRVEAALASLVPQQPQPREQQHGWQQQSLPQQPREQQAHQPAALVGLSAAAGLAQESCTGQL